MVQKRAARIAILAILIAVGALAAENILYFPFSVPWLNAHMGGVALLDMVPLRDADATNAILAALGENGRRIHLEFLWTADLALPLVFGTCLYVAIMQTVARAWPNSRRAMRLRWLGVAAAASDYLENLTSTALLIAYPTRIPALAALSGPLTIAKFALYGVAAAVVFGLWAVILARRGARTPLAGPQPPC